jgi:hypothetical protein
MLNLEGLMNRKNRHFYLHTYLRWSHFAVEESLDSLEDVSESSDVTCAFAGMVGGEYCNGGKGEFRTSLPWKGTMVLVQGVMRGRVEENSWLDTCHGVEGLCGKEVLFVPEGPEKALSYPCWGNWLLIHDYGVRKFVSESCYDFPTFEELNEIKGGREGGG